MTIIPRLFSIYRSAGYEPLTGYNPYHFANFMDAPFTFFFKDSRIHGAGGLALQEIMFLENFHDFIEPKNILVLGNAMGWSTLALGLIFPSANVIAIDMNKEANSFTNELARVNNINAKAMDGMFPGDVGHVVGNCLNSVIDLVLIDGTHENANIIADSSACLPYCHNKTLFIFHDIINWGLVDGFRHICSSNGLAGCILTRTPSGIGLAWWSLPKEFLEYLSVFCEEPELFRLYRRFRLGEVERAAMAIGKL